MADYALTTAAIMTCPHAGVLTITPLSVALKASNMVVVNKSEAALGAVLGCTWQGGTPCNGILAAVGGESATLKKAGVGVMLAGSVMTTLGTPGPFTINITETQTVLQG